MRGLATFLLIAAICIAAIWWYAEKHPRSQVAQTTQEARSDAKKLGDDIRTKLNSYNLNTDNIKDELKRTGQIIRQKASQAGRAIADATADARITTAIKAKLVADKELSAWKISVATTDGRVTLSGNVSTPDQIGKTVLLAMETDGVTEVISTLRV